MNKKATAAIALAENEKLDRTQIRDWLTSNLHDLGTAFEVSEDNEKITFFWQGFHMTLLELSRPLFTSRELQHVTRHARWWPGAERAMAPSPAHVIISVFDPDDQMSIADQVASVTLLTAAIASTHKSRGIYWGPAEKVMPPDVFIEDAIKLDQRDVPYYLWIALYSVPSGASGVGLYTNGLSFFIDFEVEIPPSDKEIDALIATMETVFDCIFALGRPPKSDEMVESGPGHFITLRPGNSTLKQSHSALLVNFFERKSGSSIRHEEDDSEDENAFPPEATGQSRKVSRERHSAQDSADQAAEWAREDAEAKKAEEDAAAAAFRMKPAEEEAMMAGIEAEDEAEPEPQPQKEEPEPQSDEEEDFWAAPSDEEEKPFISDAPPKETPDHGVDYEPEDQPDWGEEDTRPFITDKKPLDDEKK